MAKRRDKSRNRNHSLPPMRQSSEIAGAVPPKATEECAELEDALNDTFPASDPISGLSSLVTGRPYALAKQR
jgi:hypothetical protein